MKRVECKDFNTMERRVLAIFTLVGDQVVADYRDPEFRWDMDNRAIMTAEGREVRVADGRAFYDALESEYYNCSHVSVICDD